MHMDFSVIKFVASPMFNLFRLLALSRYSSTFILHINPIFMKDSDFWFTF